MTWEVAQRSEMEFKKDAIDRLLYAQITPGVSLGRGLLRIAWRHPISLFGSHCRLLDDEEWVTTCKHQQRLWVPRFFD
jgi:hypothetical protein